MSAAAELVRRGAAERADALARCLVRVDARDEVLLLQGLSSLPPGPSAEASRALLELGRAEEALAREPGEDALLRAECLLALGRLDEAFSALEGDASPDARFLRAAALLGLGRAREAAAEAAAAGGSPAADALRAALAASSGDAARAEELLSSCARRRPARAWPRVLAASVRESLGDLGGARLALREALAAEPRAWLEAEAARLEERLGVIPAALAHAERAVSAEPTTAHRRLRAELLERWREHDEAAAEYARAAAQSPGEADLLLARARCLSAAGRLEESAAEARRAAAAAPGDEGAEVWLQRALLLAGRRSEALRRARAAAVKGGRPGRARREFLFGYDALRARRWKAAAAFFDRAGKEAGAGALARKAAFYGVVARGLAARPPRAEAGLHLAGLGVDPPYTATLADLSVVAACGTAFNNVMGDEMFELLRALCRDVRAVAYHQDNDEKALADRILAPLSARGARVAFVTRGNAIVYGPLGALMMERRRASGGAWSCRPAVASPDYITARFGAEGASGGQSALDSRALERGETPPTGAPATVFWDMITGPEGHARACRALETAYGPAHECLVFDHVIGQQPLRVKVGELAGLRERLTASAIVHLPARRKP